MISLVSNARPVLIAAVLAGVIGAGAGWFVNGWRLHTEIAELKAQSATDKAAQSDAALADIKVDSAAIHAAATQSAAAVAILVPKMIALTKELKNAPPLPTGCKPDAYRVRNLEAAVDAANEAAARH
jgi:hypothetical protein